MTKESIAKYGVLFLPQAVPFSLWSAKFVNKFKQYSYEIPKGIEYWWNGEFVFTKLMAKDGTEYICFEMELYLIQ